MPDPALVAPVPPGSPPASRSRLVQADRSPRNQRGLRWTAAAMVLLGGAITWVLLTHMRPSFDAYGWLGWGRQTLSWSLNTDGAPSWKPLPYVFTLPYALLGSDPQLWLWMITATVAGAASSVFGFRLAHRLTGPAPGRPWAPVAAGLLAGAGVLGAFPGLYATDGYGGFAHQVLIANSDPMVQTLCLAAADAHLCGRRRLALILLVLAGLGRPEAWALTVPYAAYLWRSDRSARVLCTLSMLAIPATWFIVPGLTSHSWLSEGTRALHSPNVIHGNKVIGVIDRLRNLYALPLQLALAAALALALLRRARDWLWLFAAACAWVLAEIAFAYHGWSAVSRYLIEPGAMLAVLAAAGAGWVLAYAPRGTQLVRVGAATAGIALIAGLVGSLVPAAASRVRYIEAEVPKDRIWAHELSSLETAIARLGAARIKRCGTPATPDWAWSKQSELAWAVGTSVGKVDTHPRTAIRAGRPVVVFRPNRGGWLVRPYNTAAGCRALRSSWR